MPKLPYNNFVIDPNPVSETPEGNAASTSKTIAPDTLRSKGWRARMRMDRQAHEQQWPQEVLCVTDLTDGARQDLLDRKLFVRTLQEMLGDETKEDLNAAFVEIAAYPKKKSNSLHMYGSQIVLSLKPAANEHLAFKDNEKLGPPETTTRFRFLFTLAEHDGDRRISTAHYEFDPMPMRILHRYGITEEQTQRYYQGFLKMGGMAEHDYLHQLLIRPSFRTHYDYPEDWKRKLQKYPLPKWVEIHTLQLHAQVCARLFGEDPMPAGLNDAAQEKEDARRRVGERRKEAVLGWASDQFGLIADMQEHALAQATTDQQRHDIIEATTYLAEVYGHRLFRVISPEDPALYQRISTASAPEETSISEQLDRLKLQRPRLMAVFDRVQDVMHQLGLRKQKPVEQDRYTSGLEGLRAMCDYYLKDTYRNIHRAGLIPLDTVESDFPYTPMSYRTQEHLPATTIAARFLEGMEPIRSAWEKEQQKTGKIQR